MSPHIFKLVGVVVHIPDQSDNSTLHSGHYMTNIALDTGQVLTLDDQKIYELRVPNMIENGYIGLLQKGKFLYLNCS